MVDVSYLCRTGNRLFQYCFARILAQELRYQLRAPAIDGFPSTRAPVNGAVHETPELAVFELYGSPGSYRALPRHALDRVVRRVSIPAIVQKAHGCRVKVRGFFEHFAYYAPYVDQIRREWVVPDAQVQVPAQHPDDLVVHVRRGDMVGLGLAMPWEYFKQLFEVAQYRRLHIVTDFPDDPFFQQFERYDPVMVSSASSTPDQPHNVIQDFRTIMSFNKIALTSGTFGWWAAFLSSADQVYFPLAEQFGVTRGALTGTHLHVPEDRYVYVGRDATT